VCVKPREIGSSDFFCSDFFWFLLFWFLLLLLLFSSASASVFFYFCFCFWSQLLLFPTLYCFSLSSLLFIFRLRRWIGSDQIRSCRCFALRRLDRYCHITNGLADRRGFCMVASVCESEAGSLVVRMPLLFGLGFVRKLARTRWWSCGGPCRWERCDRISRAESAFPDPLLRPRFAYKMTVACLRQRLSCIRMSAIDHIFNDMMCLLILIMYASTYWVTSWVHKGMLRRHDGIHSSIQSFEISALNL
jgi:hypothetical protein